MRCYETAVMERDAWLSDVYEGAEDDGYEPLADDVWERLSSGLTKFQANCFAISFPKFLSVWDLLRDKKPDDDETDQMLESRSKCRTGSSQQRLRTTDTFRKRPDVECTGELQ